MNGVQDVKFTFHIASDSALNLLKMNNCFLFLAFRIETKFKMPANERKCEICKRSNFNGRMLGPLIDMHSISAHFNCVLFYPVTPAAESLAPQPGDDAIAGVSTRFIRQEGHRAQKLVI